MPLYTFVASFNGKTYCDQDSKSNFKGFTGTLIGRNNCYECLGISPSDKQELTSRIMRASWAEVPNKAGVWTCAIDLHGSLFSLYAVETKR
jgi:hypothetical protein